MVKEENLEKQFEKGMGCMAGFFQIFDRHQIITGKRFHHGNKRLLRIKVVDEEESSEMSGSSTPAISKELVKPEVVVTDGGGEHVKVSPGKELPPPPPLKSPHRLSVFELKEESRSSWRFSKETPRLSLDSRAIVDSKGSLHPREIRTNASILTGNRSESFVAVSVGDGGGDDKQRRSPSVIARLMGIEQLPECNPASDNAQLRRSSSESRVARDLFNSRSFDNAHSDFVVQNFKAAAAVNQTKSSFPSNVTSSTSATEGNSFRNSNEHPIAVNRGIATAQRKSQQQHRKSYFDRADVFPGPKQTMSAYADIEKKLKVRGIDEASEDLESLKQILEALQLKGLLHSNSTPPEHRNFIYDRNFRNDMKQSQQSTTGRRQQGANPSLPRTTVRRNLNEKLSNVTVSPRRDRPPPPPPQSDRTVRSPTKTLNSPTHSDSNGRRSNNSIVKTKALSVDTQRRRNNESPSDSRKTSPVQSPRTKSTVDQTVTSKSPRNKRSTAEKYRKEKITTVVTEDESSSISESTLSTSSQPESSEKSKMEDLRQGKSLLERCDKLLRSISDMNANEMQQPSPVSVLDLYKDDSFSSVSPVPKHTIDFQDLSSDLEEDWWSSILKPADQSLLENDAHNQDTDFVYIFQILRAYDQLPPNSDIFYILEKQQYLKGNDHDLLSKASVLHRRVVFDIVTEIIESNKQLPPWKAFEWTDNPLSSKPLLRKIWAEFQRIRGDRGGGVEDDIYEIVCGVLEKDFGGGGGGWGDSTVEVSEVVLDVERLVFKDLISETIGELAEQHGWRSPAAAAASRRKLVY